MVETLSIIGVRAIEGKEITSNIDVPGADVYFLGHDLIFQGDSLNYFLTKDGTSVLGVSMTGSVANDDLLSFSHSFNK